MDVLRERVREKEESLDRKARQAVGAQTEKKRLENEVNELRDHLDIKERKAAVLQRKVSDHVERPSWSGHNIVKCK